ncbi:hypothetical protein EPUS_06314 [Endocarpon pusillum Z07020]|uniref:D-isomer specific 2-hydroxyacid dehydrogenase NAD-binding domain-containing protein n=1 Tax=Endocarpon pusillum (strain Z07020 / HMAS-L-300199) TaxID=1263415 RepID=U1GY81_ENDPU|nr:uncharacterized protein EPUS_06314 [Endocarpon pusillum Z07020]ERF77096.1 hypothetical protein EPUS_06314 [Endocarpon pusillum Z07020]
MGTNPMENSIHTDKHILFALPFPEPTIQQALAALTTAHPSYRTTYRETAFKDPTMDESAWSDVDILVTFNCLPASPSLCPRLKLIHFISAGIDAHLSHSMLTSTDILVTTSTGIHGPPMAEWFILGLLAHQTRLPDLYDLQKKREWGNPLKFTSRKSLQGQRLGILGYGGIGRQAARLAQALGMEVLAYTASAKKTPESRRLTTYTIPGTGDVDGTIPSEWFSGTDKSSLHHFLSQKLDILLIAVPLSTSTRHLLGWEEFEVLATNSPSSAPNGGGPFVSNLARGDVVVQEDLVSSLNNGVIRGAAVDVADPEPLPSESTLWDAKNVLVTPHVSGVTADYLKHVVDILNINLGKWEGGESLINLFKRRRGY